MSDERVWVRYLDSTFRFRSRNGKLDVDDISKKCKLDPESLLIGPDAIAVGDDGLSRKSVVKIRQAASGVDAGDGKSQDTPFLLTGDPATPLPLLERYRDIAPFKVQDPSPTPEQTEKRILNFCDMWTNGLVPEFLSLSRDEGSYTMKFPSSRGPVCSLDKETPSLLWDGVPLGGIVQSVRQQNVAREHITMFLAPSGAGKTRTLMELALKETSLFLVGRSRDIGRGQGSGDINAVAAHLEELYGSHRADVIPQGALKCCVGAMLTSRLHVLTLLRKLCPDLAQREWTFFQLEYVRLNDVFCQLTTELLNTFVKKDEWKGVLTAFERTLRKAFNSAAGCLDGSGPIIIDDAQLVDQLLPGRFEGDKGVRRSLLHSLLVSLADFGFGTIYIAGTGEGLLKIKATAEQSGSLKRFRFDPVYSLPGFSSPQELESYMSKFIDTTVVDVDKVFRSLGKRRRFIATALEAYVMGDELGTMVLLTYGYDVCTKSGSADSALGLLHSLKDDVMKFLRRHKEGELLRQAALAYYYTGMPALVTGLEVVNEVLNCSLGEFVTGDEII